MVVTADATGDNFTFVLLPGLTGVDFVVAGCAIDPAEGMNAVKVFSGDLFVATLALDPGYPGLATQMSGEVDDLQMAAGTGNDPVHRSGKIGGNDPVPMTAKTSGRVDGHPLLRADLPGKNN
jgi:hypothetical protein